MKKNLQTKMQKNIKDVPHLRSVAHLNLLIALFLMLLSSAAQSQSFTVFDVDSSNFPIISAKFYAFDADGEQITNLSPADFEVMENGEICDVLDVSCSQPEPVAISTVLTMGVWCGMGNNLELAKEGAKELLKGMPLGKSECAITTFDRGQNFLLCDFTTNSNKLLGITDKFELRGGNLDMALKNPMAGGLLVTKRGKHKKVIILMTDSMGEITNQEAIIAEAQAQSVEIYIIYTMYNPPRELIEIAEQTGGKFFEVANRSIENIRKIYKSILLLAQECNPCEIVWESPTPCKTILDADIICLPISKSSSYSYTISNKYLPRLEISTPNINFGTVEPITTKDTVITVTAIKSKYECNDIILSNPLFSVTPKTFSLAEGESINLTLSYTPTENSLEYTSIQFLTSPCSVKAYAVGGPRVAKQKSNLELIHPNGGETFIIGSDSLITWEGILSNETVNLQISRDKGKTWKTIKYATDGLKYDWNDIKAPESNECLVSVSTGKPNQKPTDFQKIWEKTYGGNNSDYPHDAIEDCEGNYIIVGYTHSSDQDVSDFKGETDIWLIKINPSDGTLIWEKTYGGSEEDRAFAVIESSDGNYVIAGYTVSSDGDVSNHIVSDDIWVIKVSANDGRITWEKTYGEGYGFRGEDIIEASDGSYVIVGQYSVNFGVIKVSPDDGSVIWEKTYGGYQGDHPVSVMESKDGSYFLAGHTWSDDGDVSVNKGYSDFWLVKINPNNGTLIWEKTYGSSGIDELDDALYDADGNIVLIGSVGANDGDVEAPDGDVDETTSIWTAKVTENDGSVLYSSSYGGSYRENAYSIAQSKCGEYYLIAGETSSNDGDISGEAGMWFLQVSIIDGEIKWEKTFGDDPDCGKAFFETRDGSYVLVGNGAPLLKPEDWRNDYWIYKGNFPFIQSDTSDEVFSIVMPKVSASSIDMGKCLIGRSKDSLLTSYIINVGSYKCNIDSIWVSAYYQNEFTIIGGSSKNTLNGGETRDIDISFSPSESGLRKASIFIKTQAETLQYNLTGEGVEPQLAIIEKHIDFGLVGVGQNKDTLKAVTIKNISTTPLEITDTKHNFPNYIDFSTLEGGGNFTLQPGDTCRMSIRFSPSEIGLTNGTLEFHYDDTGSPAIVQLYGEGVYKDSPAISSNFDGFDNLTCDFNSTNSIEISNSGGLPLEISEMNLIGANPNDFSINETLPITVPEDSTINLNLSFIPQTTGDKSAILNIKSNAVPDSLYQIQLIGRKDSVALIPEYEVLDLGILCPDESKDSSVTIFNSGTIFTGGFLTETSNMILQNPEFQLDVNNQTNVEFTYLGQSNDGTFEEVLTITDSICGYSREIRITGEVILPQISANDISITSMNGQSKTGLLTIENSSDRDVEITGIDNIVAPFEVVGNPFPFSIPANGSYKIEIQYTPDDEVEDLLTVTFAGEPCNITTEAELTGVPVNSAAAIQAPTLEAYPGDEIEVGIVLNSSENMQIAGIETISADLTFNPTLLYPTGYDIERIDNKTAKIRIEDIPADAQAGEVIKIVNFTVGLGNAESCDLTLSNAEIIGGEADISLINGRFDLLGVCYEGGARLLNPSSESGITSISPNPTDGEIEIGLHLIEKGYTELTLYNAMGEEILTALSEQIELTGKHTIKLDISKYSTGLYFIVLRTPSHRFTEEVMILK